jgi:hypothetical protein
LIDKLNATAPHAAYKPLHPCFPPPLGRQLRRQNFPPEIENLPPSLITRSSQEATPPLPEQGILKTKEYSHKIHTITTTLRLPYVDTSYKTIQV